MSPRFSLQAARMRFLAFVLRWRSTAHERRVPPPLQLVLFLAALVAVGTLLLLMPGMTTQPISFIDALFTSASAASVTGLSVFPISTTLTFPGQVVLLLLVQIGGMGVMVGIVGILRMLGRQVSLTERLTLTASLGLNEPGEILKVLRNTVLVMLGVEALGALLLYWRWTAMGILTAKEAWFYAIFHSVTAFCNAGFDLFNGLPQYPRGVPGDLVTLVILGLLIIVGGLGFPVIMDLIRPRHWRRRRLTLHTRVTLITSLVLILVGMVGLLLVESRNGGVLSGAAFGDRIVRAWFQSVSARTAGFVGLDFFDQIHAAAQLLLMALMFIGSGPASMGGGITTGSFAVLILAMVSYGRGYHQIRVYGRTVSTTTLWRATTILMVGVSVVGIATWMILVTTHLALAPALFEVVSAFSTTGLSLGAEPQLGVFGKFVLMLGHALEESIRIGPGFLGVIVTAPHILFIKIIVIAIAMFKGAGLQRGINHKNRNGVVQVFYPVSKDLSDYMTIGEFECL